MSSRSAQRSSCWLSRPFVASLFASSVIASLMLLLSPAPSADAGFYNMVLCAGNNGSNGFATATNTTSPQNPGGIFSIENYCGPAPFPAGGNAFIRIVENQPSGSAGNTAYASVSWTAPAGIAIRAGGGYTRQPNAFNDGWRARFWAEGQDGSGPHNILMQGSGVANGSLGGIGWATCGTFCSHLWPFGSYGFYRRFVYELTCTRPAGCDRTNFNATDANTFVLTLSDEWPSEVSFTNTSPFMTGTWVRGGQTATYTWNELGSGIRFERIRIDGADRFVIDHIAANQCNRDNWGGVGEFARNFQACPTAVGIGRSFGFDTASLADGAHNMTVCTQDYSQWQGLAGTGSESCNGRTILTDNNAPGAPSGLNVVSANPQRYLSDFGSIFSLPPNPGSPVTKVHYRVVNAAGEVVQPEQVVSAVNPTALKSITGPKVPGDYKLQLWLEDQVGWVGAKASAQIPHDTVPPAAPQNIAITAPETSRAADGFDVRWNNITDAGSPIDRVYYEVQNPDGSVAVPAKSIAGDAPTSILGLETPSQRGDYQLKMWLSDAEGNIGAPATVPLAYRCVKADDSSGQQLTATIDGAESRVVKQDEGATLTGGLRSAVGPVVNAPLCIFSNVVTDGSRDFLGLSITGKDGGYRFAIAPGPSRNMIALYRPDHREMAAQAKIETIVKPTFKARKRVVRNKGIAYFTGEIPGPHNDRVVVVLQARVGKGWLAFRRYRTRDGGKFKLRYRFRRTSRPTTYVMRAQVRQTTGYPYLQGNSDRLKLRVLPARRATSSR